MTGGGASPCHSSKARWVRNNSSGATPATSAIMLTSSGISQPGVRSQQRWHAGQLHAGDHQMLGIGVLRLQPRHALGREPLDLLHLLDGEKPAGRALED